MKEKTITLVNSQKHSPRPYKKRRRFTPEETQILMDHFEKNPRPNSFHRTRLAMMIPGMTERGIQVWFQNRRAKAKLVSGNNSSEGPSSPITREEEDEIDSRANSPQLTTSNTSAFTTPISKSQDKMLPFWSSTTSTPLSHPTSNTTSSPVSPSESIDAKVICAAALQSLSQTAAALQSLSQVAASKPKTQMSINYLLS